MYTDRKYVPEGMRIVKHNDAYFSTNVGLLDDTPLVRKVIEEIDCGEYLDEYMFKSRFGGSATESIYLSTGAKTILNIMSTDKVCFSLSLCGTNAVQFIYDNVNGHVLLPGYDAGIVMVERDYCLNGTILHTFKEYDEEMSKYENDR